MFFNFCDPRLRPEIQCSTVSTEGYEVSNLISEHCNGFLAYSCIKPPINIDITFLCNIRIHHVLIWPSVGSQKSSGFQLYAKKTNDSNTPFTLLANGYLESTDSGLLFYPPGVDHNEIPTPSCFARRSIKSSLQHLTMYCNSMRLCICKTENSVPALGKIEIWGTVSPRCGKDMIASVHTLWSKQQTSSYTPVAEVKHTPVTKVVNDRAGSKVSLEVPECFLDAITWEIMTQPITLPSGKVIDQCTLQKHEENEALWGRTLSDPFTGIPFNEQRKPMVATALKSRIDKFLLENSDMDEIKRLPRVLGYSANSTMTKPYRAIDIPNQFKENVSNELSKDNTIKQNYSTGSLQKNKKHCHQLPVAIIPKRTMPSVSRIVKKKKVAEVPSLIETAVSDEKELQDTSQENSLDIEITTLVPNLKRFNVETKKHSEHAIPNGCDCCQNTILYELPCKHVICRKVLMSIDNTQCVACGVSYKKSDVVRVYK
ncbi:hypothetical protein KM043_006837 [Ampulex compressa]|nr:hypothetical protein KM043_006837 [Ampulex compressa]